MLGQGTRVCGYVFMGGPPEHRNSWWRAVNPAYTDPGRRIAITARTASSVRVGKSVKISGMVAPSARLARTVRSGKKIVSSKIAESERGGLRDRWWLFLDGVDSLLHNLGC